MISTTPALIFAAAIVTIGKPAAVVLSPTALIVTFSSAKDACPTQF